MGLNMPGLAQTAVAPMQAAMQATTQVCVQLPPFMKYFIVHKLYLYCFNIR